MQLVEIDTEPAPLTFLVTGVPGAGKTTVSRELAQRFLRAAHVAADALGTMILAGRVPPRAPSEDASPGEDASDASPRENASPGAEAEYEGDRQLLLRARNASLLCDSFCRAGFTPILDDVIVRKLQLDFYMRHLRSRPVVLVVLAPRREVILAREPGRAAHRRGLVEEWLFLEDSLRSDLAGVGVWIDTSAQTPRQSADAILDAVGEAARDRSSAGRIHW
jgi:chloramphenicol 3-O-phosphotransferase